MISLFLICYLIASVVSYKPSNLDPTVLHQNMSAYSDLQTYLGFTNKPEQFQHKLPEHIHHPDQALSNQPDSEFLNDPSHGDHKEFVKQREYQQKRDSENWTSCEEFLNNTVFDPLSVVDVDWRIFYFWSPELEETYTIRFSVPTKLLVDRFRVELDPEMKPPINWTEAELFMQTSIDFSALFMRTKKSGAYRIIPSSSFDYYNVPVLEFGLKFVKPGYLGIANCKHRLCYALAPVNKMPEVTKLEEAAASLGFYSDFNRSHIHMPGPPARMPAYQRHADEDDDLDEDLDVLADPNKLELF